MVCVVHVLIGEFDVILGSDIIGDVMVDDEAQESVQEEHVDFFVHFVEFGLY